MQTTNFLKYKLEEIAFLELRKDLRQGALVLKKGTLLPLLDHALREQVQRAENRFSTEDIVQGILFLYGLDADFRDKEIYREILSKVEEKGGSLLPYLVESARTNPLKALIMSLGYSHLNMPDAGALMLAIECSNTLYLENHDPQFEALNFDLLQQAKRRHPSWMVDYHLAFLYYNREAFAEAAEHWRLALEESDLPEEFRQEIEQMMVLNERKIEYKHALKLLFSDHVQEAIDQLNALKPEFPEWYNLHFYLGLAYRLQENWSQAAALFYEALSLKKDDANLYNELSICHLMMDETEQAEQTLRIALKFDPEHPELLTNLGIVLLRLGNKPEAIAAFEKSLQLQPEDALTKQWLTQAKMSEWMN